MDGLVHLGVAGHGGHKAHEGGRKGGREGGREGREGGHRAHEFPTLSSSLCFIDIHGIFRDAPRSKCVVG